MNVIRAEIQSALADASLALALSWPYDAANAAQRLDEIGSTLLGDLRADRQRRRDDHQRLAEAEVRQAQRAEELHRAMTQLMNLTEALGAGIEAMMQFLPRLDASLKALNQSQEATLAGQTRLREAAQDLADTASRLLSEQSTVLKSTAEALNAAEHSSAWASRQLAEVVSPLAERQAELVRALTETQQSEELLYRYFAAALDRFQEALREAAAHSVEVYRTAVDVHDLANALPALATSARDAVHAATTSQTNAARAIERVAVRLEKAMNRATEVDDRGFHEPDRPRGD